ncbi:SSV1 integrase, C-fragment [Ferroglobus placidus DSM 10642]|uniref:SSV1 integrase, C-fragment n=1 Tax=Ferroglobus placidus (strain DSM 10642 / AEDII12DO) TaxID=589924 RepID=D3S0B0_FERPA|nr:SSV1 integrase, C-fragment [Ferroglobus placidus DSM 10642]
MKQIAESLNANISDLLETKIIELIAVYESFLGTGREGFEPPTAGLRVRQSFVSFDLREFYSKHESEFREWLYGRMSKKSADQYLSAIKRYLPHGVSEPKDLDRLVTKTKYLPLGIRNFLNFLEDQYYMDNLGGFSFAIWRKHLPTKTGNKKGEKIFLTDKDVVKCFKLIKEKWNDEVTINLYKLLVFSGIRLEHAYRLLESFDKRKLIIEGKVAMYPIEEITKGHKKGYFAFLPAEFARKLEKYDMMKLAAYKSRLTPKQWKPPVDSPVSPIRIRAWFQNFAIEHGVKTEALRFIVGHSPATVGEAHYYNLKKIAKEEYKKIVDKFPIPP